MKVISIETCHKQFINGFVDDGESYKSFEVEPGKPASFGFPFPKKDYKSLAHFAGVIGKFDPDCFVLEEPIEVSPFTFDKVREVFLTDERFKS